MKTAEMLYYNDIVPTLDPYNEFTEEEKAKDTEQFFMAVENKDMEFLELLTTLFDADIQEEKDIINNLKHLFGSDEK